MAPLGHIILIQSQPACTLTPLSLIFGGEAANISFIVFGLTRPSIEHMIYRTLTITPPRCVFLNIIDVTWVNVNSSNFIKQVVFLKKDYCTNFKCLFAVTLNYVNVEE